MLRLSEDFGEVLFCLANIFGNYERQVNAVGIAPGRFAQQAGGHGFTCPRRAIKQAGVAWSHPGSHPPIVQQGIAMLQPCFDFLNLPPRAGVQHQIIPSQLRFDQAGREVRAEIRLPRLPGGEMTQHVAGYSQRSFHQRVIMQRVRRRMLCCAK